MAESNGNDIRLTEKQIRFCEEYLIDLNATQAYKRAGYSVKSDDAAAVEGHKLLRNPKIQTYIQERQKELQQKTGITQERVLQEYARIAFFDIRKAFDEDGALKKITELDDDTAAVIAGMDVYEEKAFDAIIGITKKVKINNKINALDSLAKHLGMFEADNKQKQNQVKQVFKIGDQEIEF